MRIESKVKYRIDLRHDNGVLTLNAFNDNGLIGDGVTQVEDDIWASVYKNNHGFLDKCERRGSITWASFHVEKSVEEAPKAPAKKGGKKKSEPVIEEKVVEPVSEEAPVEVVEEKVEDDNDFIEG